MVLLGPIYIVGFDGSNLLGQFCRVVFSASGLLNCARFSSLLLLVNFSRLGILGREIQKKLQKFGHMSKS